MALVEKLTYGSYEVLQNPDGSPCLLGQGSFGSTYKARHVLLGRVSALKVIREDLLNRSSKEDQEEIKRFLGEARAVGQLIHPGIAVVHDCALDKGVFYYAMEFCDGGTLRDWVEHKGPMPWSEVRAMAQQIASALDYAHGKGFLHRDIKPANIMLHGEGASRQTKIIDFGLAQSFVTDADASSVTVRNDNDNFRGNFATASPEQILEKPLDPRSDLFSLGVTLWWLLLGRNPFLDTKRGKMIAERVSDASYASSLPDGLDPAARSLLEGLLEKDVAKRIGSAHEVVERLECPTPPPPAAVEVVRPVNGLALLSAPADLEDAYGIGGVMLGAKQAKLYHGEVLATGQAVVVMLPDASLEPDARAGMRVAASRKMDFGVYAFMDWRTSAGDDVFVISKPEGCSLMGILRKFGPARFVDALPLIAHLARCFDASNAWTRCGIQVDPGDILVSARDGSADADGFRSWANLDPKATRCLPMLSAGSEPTSSSEATLSASAQELPPLAQFVGLVYRILSGSAVRYASYFTTSGYVMASGLSEDGNALLAETLCAPESQSSACHFVRALAGLESLPVPDMSPLLAPPDAHDIETGMRVTMPSAGASPRPAMVAAAQVTASSAGSKVAEIERQLALARQAAVKDDGKEAEKARLGQEEARRKQELARQSAEAAARQKQELARQSQPVTQPRSAVLPLPTTPVAPGILTKHRKVLVVVAVAMALLGTLSAIVIMQGRKSTAEKEGKARLELAENQRSENQARASAATEAPPERPVLDVPPGKDDAAAGSSEPRDIVKVPDDVKSMAEAVKLCKEGGTIVIAGGTYAEAIHLTKSVKLFSKPSAIFDARDLRSNLIVASGAIQVSLQNIQLKNTQEEATSSPASSPALVLIKNGASMQFEGCVIEGSTGDGVSLADKASATFSNCPILKHRGNGVRVSSASKVEISMSAITDNGFCGIVLENVGSSVVLGSGTKVEKNSRNGVEVGKGAQLTGNGASIRNNEKVGVFVDGSGSQARLDASCVIADHHQFGIGVQNGAQLVLSNSAVEGNGEGGLYVKSGAQAEVLASHFKSNGPMGIALIDAPSKISVVKSEFKDHADLAVCFEEGTATVEGCQFTNNKGAIYYGQGASGSAAGNADGKGPIEDIRDARAAEETLR